MSARVPAWRLQIRGLDAQVGRHCKTFATSSSSSESGGASIYIRGSHSRSAQATKTEVKAEKQKCVHMGLLILHIGDNIEWILNEMKSSKSCNSSGVRRAGRLPLSPVRPTTVQGTRWYCQLSYRKARRT